jgi:hypothetical protein
MERTVSRTQSDAYTHENKEATKLTKNNTSSTTHTATKRRPAITKGPADEPTREDKEDVGPSARATAGKRASTASTKVRNNHSRSLFFFLYARRTRMIDRSNDPTSQAKQSAEWLFVVLFFCVVRFAFSSSIDVIDRSSTSPIQSIKQIFFHNRDFFTSIPAEKSRV